MKKKKGKLQATRSMSSCAYRVFFIGPLTRFQEVGLTWRTLTPMTLSTLSFLTHYFLKSDD